MPAFAFAESSSGARSPFPPLRSSLQRGQRSSRFSSISPPSFIKSLQSPAFEQSEKPIY